MAVNGISRWNLLRDVTVEKKSGTLVLQIGQQYVSWIFQEGDLAWISSTHPDYTMTQFLLQNHIVEPHILEKARSRINDSSSLGAVLFKEGMLDTGTLQEWTARYAAWLCPLLLQTSTHMYWADRLLPTKSEFVHLPGIPLSQILLSCERSSVEVRSAFQFPCDLPERYRVENPGTLFPFLTPSERRLLPYLRRSNPLEQIYADPELDRLTCCRTLLILWIAGRLHPAPMRGPAQDMPRGAAWLARARTLPADWVIPLLVGILLGVLLSPSPAPSPVPQQSTQSLHQSLKEPAWRAPADGSNEGK